MVIGGAASVTSGRPGGAQERRGEEPAGGRSRRGGAGSAEETGEGSPEKGLLAEWLIPSRGSRRLRAEKMLPG